MIRIALTPSVPSKFISLARFTKPYAPRPISPSITNSEMLRSPTLGVRSTPGVGGPVLLATLKKLAALLARTNFIGVAGGGEGGCEGTIETRPAIKETRWCEERRREWGAYVLPRRGEDGVDNIGERLNPSEPEDPIGDSGLGEEHRDCMGDLERGPGAKLPESAGGGRGAMVTTGDAALDGPLDAVGEEAHAERVLARRLGWLPALLLDP